MSYINLNVRKRSPKFSFGKGDSLKTCWGFPHSDTANIEAKCLKFCGLQRGSAPLQTTKFQAFSINIEGSGAGESPAHFRES